VLAALHARRLWTARQRRPVYRMGPRTPVAAAERRARALRTRGGSRPASLSESDGTVFEFDAVAARTDLGSTGHPARTAQVWLPDRQRDSPDVGACRVHQAAALGLGRAGLRHDRRGRRPLPEARTKAEPPSRLEIQP